MAYTDGYRALVRMVVILLAIPVFYYVTTSSIAYVTGPDLYEGDVLEKRTCRECGGDGKQEPDPSFPMVGDRCVACRGKGEVEVIVPGPNRPTRIWGTVQVADKPRSEDDLDDFLPPAGGRSQTLMTGFGARAVPGAIGKVTVRFLTEAGAVAEEIQSNSGGGFSQRLGPGKYKVVFRKEGYEPLETALEVPVMEGLIWLEKAETIREDASRAEILSRSGLTLEAHLAPRKSGHESWARAGYGLP